MVKQRWFGIILLLVISVFGIWWWRWQAPYRTLIGFLRALETGDFDILYNLTPIYERKYVKIDVRLIRHTYTNYLRPHFLNKYRLVQIQRVLKSGYWWKHGREVSFFLWYRDDKGRLKVTAVSVVRPLEEEEKWKVPFSYFVYCVTKTLYGVDRVFEITRRLGYAVIADPQGSFIQEPP